MAVLIDRTAPSYSLRVDNTALEMDILRRVEKWVYEDAEHMDELRLTLDNSDRGLDDEQPFPMGALVEFRHGYAGNLTEPKYFIVSGSRGWVPTIDVVCLDVVQIFNTEQHDRAWLDATLEQVIEDIADGNKIGYEMEERTDANGTPLKFDYFQPKIQDFAFLWNLGQQIGYEVWFEDGTLFFMPRRYWQQPYMELVYEGPSRHFYSFTPETGNNERRSAFKTAGIDLEKKQQFIVTENGETRRAYYLGDKLMDWDEAIGRYRTVEEEMWVRHPVNTLGEGQDLLQGKWVKETDDQITAVAKMEGEPELRAKRVIEVANVSEKWSGKYYVKRVVHTFSQSGYDTEAHLSRNATMDAGEKYSRENLDTVVNRKKASPQAFIKQISGHPKLDWYRKVLGVK